MIEKVMAEVAWRGDPEVCVGLIGIASEKLRQLIWSDFDDSSYKKSLIKDFERLKKLETPESLNEKGFLPYVSGVFDGKNFRFRWFGDSYERAGLASVIQYLTLYENSKGRTDINLENLDF